MLLTLKIIGILVFFVPYLISVERDVSWYENRYSELIDAAIRESIPDLYYNKSTKTSMHNAIEVVDDEIIDRVLVKRMQDDLSDIAKWNILVMLLGRNVFYKVGNSHNETLKFSIDGLASNNDWLRTEAVYGIGFLGDLSTIPMIEQLQNDNCDAVVDESQKAVKLIKERYSGPVQ